MCVCVVPTDHRQPNLWAASPRPIISPVAPPASHTYGSSHVSRTRPQEAYSPTLRSRTPTSPPPLPLELPHPALRHVPSGDATPLQTNIHYKPYPDQPPSPTPEIPLSPRLKHRLVLSPPSRRKQQPPQRQILQQIQYKPKDSQPFLHHQRQYELNEHLRQQQEASLLRQKEERFRTQQQNQTRENPIQGIQKQARSKEQGQDAYSLPLERYLQQQEELQQQHQYHQQQHQVNAQQLHSLPNRYWEHQSETLSHSQRKEASRVSEEHHYSSLDNQSESSAPLSPEMSRALTLPRPQNLPTSSTPNPPENFPYQLITPPGHSQPLPMKEFMEQLQEDLVSPKSSMSIKQQYEEFERKRKLEEQGGVSDGQAERLTPQNEFSKILKPTQHSQVLVGMSRRPSYPPPQEPRTHHRRPPPPAPLNARSPPAPRSARDPFSPTSHPLSPPSYLSKAGFFSPPATLQRGPGSQPLSSKALFSPPPSSSSTRMFSPPPTDPNRVRVPPSKVYRPTAMSEMLLRGSPTPSLPSDVLRHRQDSSPTPSQSSALSEQVLGGVSLGRGKRSRGLNLFLKQQNRMAALDSEAQGSLPICSCPPLACVDFFSLSPLLSFVSFSLLAKITSVFFFLIFLALFFHHISCSSSDLSMTCS